VVYNCLFLIRVESIADANLNQTNTPLEKLCEVDEFIQEEPNISNYF